MRVKVGKAISAKKGDVVVIDCRFSDPRYQAKLEIFSCVKGYEFSPHVASFLMAATDGGKPMMVQPMWATLNDQKPQKRFIIHVDEDLDFQVFQTKDVIEDPSAKIKAVVHGKFKQTVGRLLRNVFRRFGSSYEPIPQYDRGH